jgi:HAE1 family hydrophobic/amphiphilic exporter-1
MRPYEAAMEGADAIGLAVVATTFTIVAVFARSLHEGMVGQFFREFGLTVCVAVLFSLLVARLLTPLMAAYLLKPASHPKPRKPIPGFYRNALEWALDHRIVACIIGGVIFIGSIFLVPRCPPASSRRRPRLLLHQRPGSARRHGRDMEDTPAGHPLFEDRARDRRLRPGRLVGPGQRSFMRRRRRQRPARRHLTVVLHDKRELRVTEIRP